MTAELQSKIELQNAEFKAVSELAKQYRRITMTAPVDDDYPEVAFEYNRAVENTIRAFKATGRIPDHGKSTPTP